MTLDFARAHPPRVHRDDLVVEARESRLPFGHYLRLKGAAPIPRRLHFQRAEVALQRLAGRAIARIAAVVSRRVVLLIPQVIGQLGVHRPLQYPFGQALQQTILPDHVLWLVIVASNSSSNSSRIGFSSV